MRHESYRIRLPHHASDSLWCDMDQVCQELPRRLRARGATVLWVWPDVRTCEAEMGYALDGSVWTVHARIVRRGDVVCSADELNVPERLRHFAEMALETGGMGEPDEVHHAWRAIMRWHAARLSPSEYASWFAEPGHPDEVVLRLQAASPEQLTAVRVEDLARVLTAESARTRLAAIRTLARR